LSKVVNYFAVENESQFIPMHLRILRKYFEALQNPRSEIVAATTSSVKRALKGAGEARKISTTKGEEIAQIDDARAK